MTDLLDPHEYPALELARGYHERWEVELAYDELKTHLTSVTHGTMQTTFRSRTPDGVEQEVYASMTAYNLIRALMESAGEAHDVPPLHISFIEATKAIKLSMRRFAEGSRRTWGALFERLLDDIADCRIDRPRRKRAYPRRVKRKMSNFRLKRPVDTQSLVDFCSKLRLVQEALQQRQARQFMGIAPRLFGFSDRTGASCNLKSVVQFEKIGSCVFVAFPPQILAFRRRQRDKRDWRSSCCHLPLWSEHEEEHLIMNTSKRVLIVDDERNIRTTLDCAFRDEGFETRLAENAEEAWTVVEEWEGIDVILLDLKLPGMSGLDFLRRLRGDGRDTSVIVITAYGTVEVAVEAMRLGAADVLEKPFTPDRVRTVVAEALEEETLSVDEAYGALLAKVAGALKRRDYSVAMASARKAVGLDPNKATAFNVIGAILALQGQVSRAQDFFRAALAIDPTFEPSRSNLKTSGSTRNVDTKLDLGVLIPREEEEHGKE